MQQTKIKLNIKSIEKRVSVFKVWGTEIITPINIIGIKINCKRIVKWESKWAYLLGLADQKFQLHKKEIAN